MNFFSLKRSQVTLLVGCLMAVTTSAARADDTVSDGMFVIPAWFSSQPKPYEQPTQIFRVNPSPSTMDSGGVWGQNPYGYGNGLGLAPYGGWGSGWSFGSGPYRSYSGFGPGFGFGGGGYGLAGLGYGLGLGGLGYGLGGLGYGLGGLGYGLGGLGYGLGGLGYGGFGVPGFGFAGIGVPGFGYGGWGGPLGGFGGIGYGGFGYGGFGGFGGYGGYGAGGWGSGMFGGNSSFSGPKANSVIQTAPSKPSGNYYAPSTVDTSASGSYYASDAPALTPIMQHKTTSQSNDYWGSPGSNPFVGKDGKDLNSVPWNK